MRAVKYFSAPHIAQPFTMKNFLSYSAVIYLAAYIASGVVQSADVQGAPCGDDSWIPYKDEKCVKLFKTFQTRQRADEACAQQRSLSDSFAPSLISIRSSDEQKFLTEYVYNSTDSNNIWIGAERRPDSSTEFVWIDGSPVQRFTYWAIDRPTDDARRSCVFLQSPLSSRRDVFDLRWTDVSCTTGAWFICEKLQAWPIERFQQTVLSIRRDLQYKVESFTRQNTDMAQTIGDLRNNLTAQAATIAAQAATLTAQAATLTAQATTITTQGSTITTQGTTLTTQGTTITNQGTTITSQGTTITNQGTQLRNLQENPVPVGFVYVQLSGQPEPQNVWTTVRWTEITSTYAGLFFRAAGGGAATFGSTQAENFPRLSNVQYQNAADTITNIAIPATGAWSPSIFTGSNNWGVTHAALRFHYSGTGEVRPRNQAVRIWRRIQ